MAGGLKVGLTTLGQPGGQVGTAPRAVLGAMAPRKDAMVITSLPSIQILAVSGWRLAVWKKNEQGETGKFAADMRHPSQSSGLRFPSEPFDFRSGGRWQPQVAGGGCSMQPSTQSSTQPSIQSSVIHSVQPDTARSARSADPTSRQGPELTKNDEPRTKNQELRTAQISPRSARGAAPTQST